MRALFAPSRWRRPITDNQVTSELDGILAPSTAALLRGHEPVYQLPNRRGALSRLGNLFRERRLRRQRRHWAH